MLEIGRLRAPEEACGVFTIAGIHELKNVSPSPLNSYLIDIDELVEKLRYEFGDTCSYSDFVIWHTHPNGKHGPSAGDLRNKLWDLQYFVISVPDGVGTVF